MDDFTDKPYAQWVESMAKGLFEFNPTSIICIAERNGLTFSGFYHADYSVKARAIKSLIEECLVDWLRVNRKMILKILSEQTEEDDPL